uniref:Uncharacterized protein n=1 Tax=Oryza glumipatula TaxID=40148 RepID=A0A0D9Y5T7_9ORYZ
MGRRVMNAALRTTVNAGRRRRALPYGPSPPSRSPSSTSSSTEAGPQDISEGNRTIQNSDASNTAVWYFSRLMDYFVITTPNFVLDHEETISQNVGGQVHGYFH